VPPRPYYSEYAAPRHLERSSYCKYHFDQNRSRARPKKKVVKQVYHVKNDSRKYKILDLNSTIEKTITLLKDTASDGKKVRKLYIDILGAEFEQKKVRVPKFKKEFLLSKIEIKSRCLLGLPKWQEDKLQKLSAEKLKEKDLGWVPKRSVQAQKDDVQASGATKAKERRRFKKNCQVGGLHRIIKIVMASSILSTYTYVMELIPWYVWLSLNSLF
jgi:hypothetical protein